MAGTVQYLNPERLHQNPAFTQVVSFSGAVKTVCVSGQNALDADGEVVGEGDLAAQTEQIFHNLELALRGAGARLEHVVKWTIYVVQGQDLRSGFGVFGRAWGERTNPPALTVLVVAGLANPAFQAELEAVAIVPGEEKNDPERSNRHGLRCWS